MTPTSSKPVTRSVIAQYVTRTQHSDLSKVNHLCDFKNVLGGMDSIEKPIHSSQGNELSLPTWTQ